MADPRFFENLGPFTLAQVCEKAGIAIPAGADGAQQIFALAALAGAGPDHLTFFTGASTLREAFASSRAGVCLVPDAGTKMKRIEPPAGMTLLEVASFGPAYVAI